MVSELFIADPAVVILVCYGYQGLPKLVRLLNRVIVVPQNTLDVPLFDISHVVLVKQVECTPDVFICKEVLFVESCHEELVVIDPTALADVGGLEHLAHVRLRHLEVAAYVGHVLRDLVRGEHAVLSRVPLNEGGSYFAQVLGLSQKICDHGAHPGLSS